MRFVIGGSGSGKCSYAERAYGIGEIPDACYDTVITARAVKNFHIFIRTMMEDSRDISSVIDEMLEKNPDIIIISTEIGYGVVPMDSRDREWRERAGRVCCELAKRAETVIRVVCGVGNVIK